MGQWSPDQQRRLARLDPETWQHVAPHAPIYWRPLFLRHLSVTIATYPEVIGLAELFIVRQVGHHWQWRWAARATTHTSERVRVRTITPVIFPPASRLLTALTANLHPSGLRVAISERELTRR